MKFKLVTLISMLILGITYGVVYHYLLMPFLGDGLFVQCLGSGTMFGLITYFIVVNIAQKYYELEKDNRSLKRDINIDQPTGLYNRRAFDQDIKKMPKEIACSVIFIDVDNFRKFNNEFGHDSGDAALQKVSETIKNNIRQNDRAYRYGGDEIVIVLKECSKINANQIGEKIRDNISSIDNSPQSSITISLGRASYPEDGEDISTIIKLSDKALLKAKKSGKNRMVDSSGAISRSVEKTD
ncbi:MAG: GGDEF domain-containing protein [Peptostreptococcaceae bacterium]|nr:GGDEF domain-containing protein [Peptostreptococcaceae bacterium]